MLFIFNEGAAYWSMIILIVGNIIIVPAFDLKLRTIFYFYYFILQRFGLICFVKQG